MKFPVSAPVQKNADLVVWDSEQEYDSPVLKELLTVSGICLSYFSFSVVTSVFAGVYHLSAKIPPETLVDDQERYWFSAKKNSLYLYEGVCDAWPIDKVINELPGISLNNFRVNPQARKEYVRKFIGYDDYDSSKRILDELQRGLKSGKGQSPKG